MMEIEPGPQPDPQTARLIYEELTRRFGEENRWKDELESKAGTFLGFVGLFMSIFFVYGTSDPGSGPGALNLVLVPSALQACSALLLLNALYGHGQFTGPSPADVLGAQALEPTALTLELADAYAITITVNRLPHLKAVASFHLSLVFSAAGLVQVVAAILGAWVGNLSPAQGPLVAAISWLPAIVVFAILVHRIIAGYAKDRRAAEDLLHKVARAVGLQGGLAEGLAR